MAPDQLIWPNPYLTQSIRGQMQGSTTAGRMVAAATAAGGTDPLFAPGGRDPRPAVRAGRYAIPPHPTVTERFGTAPKRSF
ncbi:hypothetical protein ACP26L_11955 [Paenibacillus sp. S-38]|uniref:hypothetical protein n=1 Tax=Paenibacillus sp. S-38 TaxID=3416710 RepID=UPI003CEA5A2A